MAIRQLKGLKNAQVPAVNLTKRDPQLAAAVSKMTAPQQGSQDSQLGQAGMLANTYAFRSILQKRARRNSDAAQIMRLLPDNELSAQILVSSILSPKDMSSIELNYTGPKDVFSSSLSSQLLDCIRKYFEDDFKLKDKITEMVREPLFEKGSYSMVVIPENAIDDFINGDKFVSLEALAEVVDNTGKIRPVGILGPSVKKNATQVRGMVMESHFAEQSAKSIEEIRKIDTRISYVNENYEDDKWTGDKQEEYLHVTDNPSVLKLPLLNQKVRKQATKERYRTMGFNLVAEAFGDDARLRQAITPHRQYGVEPVALLKKPSELTRKSVGAPLAMKLPSESVIPVHVPGNPKEHVGFFIILDEEGHPLEQPDGEEYYQNLNGSASTSGNSLTSNLIRRVNTNLGTNSGFDRDSRQHLEYASRLYGEMVERDLISRVKNGAYASGVALAKNENIYRIMFSRVLAKKFTQILYVPVEFMTYIAFKYDDDGIGRSLLDDNATLNMLRAVTLFSDVMGGLKNSIGRTRVSATIPDKDPNWMKTVERMQDNIVRGRQLNMPLGVSNIADIIDFTNRAGYEWEFTGHPGMPDLNMKFEAVQMNYQPGDSQLNDLLRKLNIMGYGLTPEMVDNGFNSEFAATVLHNNVLLAKRVSVLQAEFTPQLSDLGRKLISNNQVVVDELIEILQDKFEDIKIELEDNLYIKDLTDEVKKKLVIREAIAKLLEALTITLPQPVSVTLETQMADLDTYSQAIDKALDAYISNEFISEDNAGAISNAADIIKKMVKAHYIRKWFADKGVLPELGDLIGTDEEGEPLMNFGDEITDHIKGLIRGGIMALRDLSPMIAAANKDLEKIQPPESDVELSGSSSYSSGDTGGGGEFGGGGDDFGLGGGDDFNFGGDDLGLGGGGEEQSDLTIPSDQEAQANAQQTGGEPI